MKNTKRLSTQDHKATESVASGIVSRNDHQGRGRSYLMTEMKSVITQCGI